MNTKPSNNDGWNACPPGELGRMVDRLRADRRKQAIVRGGVVSAVTLMLAVTLWQALPMGNENVQYNYGGITCSQVQLALPQFLNDQLDEETAAKVRVHLAQCEKCRPRAEQMGWVALRGPVPCHDATCAHCRHQAELIARGLIAPTDTPQVLVAVGTFPPISGWE